ncbi:MAG: histidine phosphatase family protein [Oscillospiraceae bacterium]|nr:histidine phosphatase family protein [Oscillospiraceae bacterium]MBP1574448.1 histidine phosphatase family protein [Oscillospiraceae bacterium]MBQ5322687.1 histidine phosphatase family protein [Oscillospiraceae bacterium]MBQ8595103.1 histidine phosphatase family protein [Oscillospiraceae bacterium]
MKTIITIQHTQSLHHTNGMVGSWTDWELSDFGKEQAENIGRNLAEELSEKYVIYSSDLLRAKQTAEIVGKHLGVEPIFKTELRERNLGEAVGKSVEWLRKNMEKPERTVDDRLFPSAESRREEWNRLKLFFDEITSNKEEYIIIVSHGDLLSVFNAMWLGLSVESLEKSELFGVSGGVSFLFENPEGKRFIKKMSDTSYMK